MSHQFTRLEANTDRGASFHAYVERGGEMVTRHPFDLYRVRLTAFTVPVDPDRVATYCERTFAAPSGGAECYRPVGRHALVSFADITSIRSSDPPDDALGVSAERELAVWLPLWDTRRRVPTWTTPYLIVNEAAPVAGGREIFGFPKQLGDVTWSVPDGEPAEFTAHTRCIRTFEAGARLQRHRVLRFTRVTDGRHTPSAWTTPAKGVAEFAGDDGAAPHGGWAREAARLATGGWRSGAGESVQAALMFLAQLAHGRVPVVLLKQFRDAVDPRRACSQAVVGLHNDVLDFHGGGRLAGSWRADVADLDGEPLQRELGLTAGTADLPAFWLDFDFRIGGGRLLWEARR